jgi:hypothetical protein
MARLVRVALYIGLAAIGHFFGRRANCRFTPYGEPAHRARLLPPSFIAPAAIF